jgi:hypothetical protein
MHWIGKRVLDIFIFESLFGTIGIMLAYVIGIFLNPHQFEPIWGHQLLKLGDLNLSIIEKALGMFVLEMEVQSGITEINFITVALEPGGIRVGAGLAASTFFVFRVFLVQ